MPFWKRKSLWAFLLFLTLGSWAWTQLPYWIISYTEANYPYLKIRGGVDIIYARIEFHDVEVTKPWLKGRLDWVSVNMAKEVWVHGGEVDIDLDKKPPAKEGVGDPTKGIDLRAFYLDSVKMDYKTVATVIEGFEIRPDSYCFQKSVVTTDDSRVPKSFFGGTFPILDVKHGCVLKDKSKITLGKVSTKVFLPKQIPKLGGEHDFVLKDVEVYPIEEFIKARSFRFEGKPDEEDTVGTFVEGELVSLSYNDGILSLDSKDVTTNHTWVSPTQATFNRLALALPKDPGENGRIVFGDATILFNLKDHHIEGEETCSDWLSALPSPRADVFKGMADNFEGKLRFDVIAAPIPHVEIKNACKYKCSESPIKDLKGAFSYFAYEKDGETLFVRKTGPGTKDWVPLQLLPVNVPNAFIRMEDPSFLYHRGILTASLKAALEQNMEKGYFFRGGSTITQQLAKNLWLKRHKTIGRKVEEALLTIALETCLNKNEILETYLNVVELGPDLYGIGPAIKQYFDKDPENLSLDEAYYLASLLPHPKKALPPYKGGIRRARRLMESLAKRGLISEDLVPIKETEYDLSGWEIAE